MRNVKKLTDINTYPKTYSQELRKFIYKYKHILHFSKEIWIQIFSYMNTFRIYFDQLEKHKKINIPPSITTLELNYFLSHVKNPTEVIVSMPQNIQTLRSLERSNTYLSNLHDLNVKSDVFFLYPFRNLKKLYFNDSFNELLKPNIFPKTLNFIHLGDAFNQKLTKDIFHEGMKTIIFGDSFNQPVRPDILPDSLENLEFGDHFDLFFKRKFKFPSNLKNLEFGMNFGRKLRYSFFPKKLESLKLKNSKYNSIIKKLPRKLRHLHIGGYYYDIDRNWFPNSIETVYFYNLYSKMLFHELPINIKKFKIENDYRQPILFTLNPYIESYDVKPYPEQNLHEDFYLNYNKIVHFELKDVFHDLHFKLPESVQIISLFSILKPLKKFFLPSNLYELNFHSIYGHKLTKDVLPPNLDRLRLGNYDFKLEKDVLPNRLSLFELCKSSREYSHIIEPGVLPESLRYFTVHIPHYRKTNVIVEGTLPKKLKELTIHGYHTFFNEGIFNIHLEKLMIDKFNQPITQGLFPRKLKSLSFYFDFNLKIDENTLPPKLRYLNLGNSYCQPIEKNVLPLSLIHLRFGDSFNYPLHDVLPPNLEYLRFGICFFQELPYNQIPKIKIVKIHQNCVVKAMNKKPCQVILHSFEENYPSDNDSYAYYSD